MSDKFIEDVLNEIDEKYIEEAIIIQQRRNKISNRFFIPLVAGIVFTVIAGVLLLGDNNTYDSTNRIVEAEKMIHGFSLVTYAAETSDKRVVKTPEESHEYVISSNEGNIANRFYTLTSVEEMPEAMKKRIETSEDLVMCFGFNMIVEGDGIESITYEALDTEFVKKVDYSWNKDAELFEKYQDCLGIGSKEYFDGSNGREYKNCGDTELKHWLFVPVGNSYTVPYEKQGDSRYLYALKVVYDKEKIYEAEEYSSLNIDDNFKTINDTITKRILGEKIKVKINYIDGCTEEMIVEITHSRGISMKIKINEIGEKELYES